MHMNNQRNALHEVVPFVQFKRTKKHTWWKIATLLKVTLLHGCYSCFLNCSNGAKLHKASQITK